ncbi:DNA-directed DNA polymerase alpha subunit pol12 [Thoreauomyces humboldtii]|nr:DNA-directed DNA polymerase alpha subunit pol12 [Thoreauomyces humboldtii]
MLTAAQDSVRSDVLTAFGPQLASHPEVLERLVSFTKLFNVAAEDLHAKWEAFTLTPAAQTLDDDLSLPTLAHLGELRASLMRTQQAARQGAILGTSDNLVTARDVNPFTEGKMFTNDSLENMFSQGTQDPLGSFRTPAKTRRKVVPKDAGSFANRNLGQLSASKFPTSASKRTPQTPASAQRFQDANSPASPSTPLNTKAIASPNVAKFADRINRAKQEEVLNEDVPASSAASGRHPPCDISLLPGQQTEGYRYMYERAMERGDFLDERIDNFANLIGEHVQSTLPETDREGFQIQHPGVPNQETFTTVGRVCCDTVTANAKLNRQSVVIESSRAIGGGSRTHISLETLPGYSLFPGQLIGLEGMNSNGKVIDVSKIIQPPLPPKPSSTPSQLAAYYPEENEGSKSPLSIFIANGPYTLEDSLGYEPFEDLVKQIETDLPDVVILQGPFVDAEHPMVLSGDVDMVPDELFRTQISARITRILRFRPAPNAIKVIMIPSTRDACSEWVSFPQPSLAAGLSERAALNRRRQLGIPGEAMLFPNPVQFTINETVFACCSTDVLWQMCGEELTKMPRQPQQQPPQQTHGTTVPETSDVIHPHRISRMFRHMLSQRSFYPLFPPALDEACLDLSRTAALELQATPDVLVVGSRLQYTARKVEGCICVNPGLLVKGRGGGTFSKFTIWPLDMDRIRESVPAADVMEVDGEEELYIGHDVDVRCRVEIQRI